jgi:Na+-transporting methylmalonyl-CoA/oxaloacetate decarboxylase beta subunit
MIGTVWLRIGTDAKSDAVQDIASSLFFIAAFMVFMSVAVQIAYVEEKVSISSTAGLVGSASVSTMCMCKRVRGCGCGDVGGACFLCECALLCVRVCVEVYTFV